MCDKALTFLPRFV